MRAVPPLIVAAGFLCLGVSVGATQPPDRRLIGGIGVGDTPAQVRAVLGPPMRVEKTGDALDPYWHYKGLVVGFWAETHRVERVETKDPVFCTTGGVCPGISAAAALKVLGQPLDGVMLSDGVHAYSTEEDTCELEVVIHLGRVKSLALSCQP